MMKNVFKANSDLRKFRSIGYKYENVPPQKNEINEVLIGALIVLVPILVLSIF